jgi:hypothetical protein
VDWLNDQAVALTMHQGGVAGQLEFDRNPDGLIAAVLEEANFSGMGHFVIPALAYA